MTAPMTPVASAPPPATTTAVQQLRRRTYFRLFGADRYLNRIVEPGMRVLDVGCSDGRGSEVLSDPSIYGADIYRPALSSALTTGRRGRGVQCDARRLPYRNRAFDVVVALDVVEHFDKDEALGLLSEMERVAAGVVVVLTPNGFVTQPAGPDEPWQEHRCGFTADELADRGYRVRGVGGLAGIRGPYGAFRGSHAGAAIAVASALFTTRRPSLAYHLLAMRPS